MLKAKRTLQLLLVCICAFTMLGATSPSSRFNTLGHKLMCPCGCAEILLECNHVGCPDSNRMIGELKQQMAAGLGDTAVLNFFSAKYGPTVLAAPMRGGFDIVAWIVPFAVLALGIAAVVLVLRAWKKRQVVPAPAAPLSDELRERIRRDTTYGG